MSYVKGLFTGGVIFLAGYLVGSCHTPQRETETLEKKVVQQDTERTRQLLRFLKQSPKQKEGQEQPFSLESIWQQLPPETKTQLIKQFATHQLESTYEDLKTRSGSMYHELKHYFGKHLGGKE